MKLVRATDASKRLKVNIKELGRMANTGEVFQVSDARYSVLSGNNRFHAKFVIPAPKEVENKVDITPTKKPSTPARNPVSHTPTIKIEPVTDEEPEIWLIEPGKNKVRVDKNLKPIVEDVVEESVVKLAEEPEEVVEAIEEPKEEPEVTINLKGSEVKVVESRIITEEDLEKDKNNKNTDAKLDTIEDNNAQK